MTIKCLGRETEGATRTLQNLGKVEDAVRLLERFDNVEDGFRLLRRLQGASQESAEALVRYLSKLDDADAFKAAMGKLDELDNVDDFVKTVVNASSEKTNLTRLSVKDKLLRYLLNPEHPEGGTKAKWFEEALGFTKDNMDDLARQLVFDPKKAVQTEVTEYGIKYNQVIPIKGANGKIIDVPTAWIKNKDGVIRLITAIPVKR
jgi:hypothetical protein